MKTIGIERSSFNMSNFEHRCINNIKKIYQHAGKYDDQQKIKDILEAALIYTPEGLTDNSPNVHMPSTPVKKPSAMKSLCLFTNILDVKHKIEKRCFVAAKSIHKAMKVGNSLLSDPNDGGIKDARDEDGKIIISDSTLSSLLPPQFKKCLHVTRSCVDVNVEFLLC